MKSTGWYWPWLLVAGMSGIVGVNVWMLVVANGDANGTVVERDYYRKAVQWDSTMALQAASARLGWQAGVSLSAGTPDASVEVHLTDAAGAAVAGATVQATLIHNADAGRPVELALRDLGDGRYVASHALGHRGMWEVRLSAVRAADRFATTTRVELDPAPGAE